MISAETQVASYAQKLPTLFYYENISTIGTAQSYTSTAYNAIIGTRDISGANTLTENTNWVYFKKTSKTTNASAVYTV